jgi:hypothetical protein
MLLVRFNASQATHRRPDSTAPVVVPQYIDREQSLKESVSVGVKAVVCGERITVVSKMILDVMYVKLVVIALSVTVMESIRYLYTELILSRRGTGRKQGE